MRTKPYEVVKWRNMSAREMWLWAHLRLDKIEEKLGLDNRMPDLQEITDKLEEEATTKEYYTHKAPFSISLQCISHGWGRVRTRLCYLVNRLLCLNQPRPQNKRPNKSKSETDSDE